MTAKLKSIKPTSLLKFVAGSLAAFYFSLSVLFGLLGMAGCKTVHMNREAVTGLWALPMAILIGIIMWFFSTVFVWIALVTGFPLFRTFEEIVIEGELAPEPPNQVAPPNCGATKPPANSGLGGGPPSVS